MSTQTESEREPRVALSRQRVLRAAVTVADESGVESLTMRRIAEELGSEAMSLYYHVANKDDMLSGIVEFIVAEINTAVEALEPPTTKAGWKGAVRERILTSRGVLLRHPWATRLFESRTSTSPAVLVYHNGLVGMMRAGGFSYDLIHHALHALGSRAMGFSQELFDPGDGAVDEESQQMMEQLADDLPHLVGMLQEVVHDDPESTLGWCDDQTEFEFGLDLILDGLDRMRRAGD